MKLQMTSESIEQTDALGRVLATLLRAGDVVLLDGELGSGKTTLVRTIASAMGVDERLVSSPTFVTINEYPTGRRTAAGEAGSLVHIDAYRFVDADELDALGFDRASAGEVIVLIEWANRLAAVLPETGREISVHLTHAGLTARTITIELPDAWAQRVGIDDLAAMMDRLDDADEPAGADQVVDG
jgi:tRNA threonylcarbamoyladenosine biosynthesis protein TsaE